jgi:hypothetical protein
MIVHVEGRVGHLPKTPEFPFLRKTAAVSDRYQWARRLDRAVCRLRIGIRFGEPQQLPFAVGGVLAKSKQESRNTKCNNKRDAAKKPPDVSTFDAILCTEARIEERVVSYLDGEARVLQD